MSYYRPYAGDYKTYGYGGDPGFFSDVWKGIKKIAPIVGGFATGGVVGALTAYGATKSKPSTLAPASFPGVGFGPSYRPGMPGGPGAPGAWPTPGQLTGPVGATYAQNGCCPSGFHLAKDGSGKCVKNRSMNVANPRALRRAIRREKGFGKLASRVGYIKRKSGSRKVAKCA